MVEFKDTGGSSGAGRAAMTSLQKHTLVTTSLQSQSPRIVLSPRLNSEMALLAGHYERGGVAHKGVG
jgi:hypothetical protein